MERKRQGADSRSRKVKEEKDEGNDVKHAGLLLALGIKHRTGTISICAFSDGALPLAGDRILVATAVASTHIIERID